MLEGFWVVEVRVTTKARENRVLCLDDGILRVRVTEAPERGKANDAVIELLADFLSLPKNDVTLIAGEPPSDIIKISRLYYLFQCLNSPVLHIRS